MFNSSIKLAHWSKTIALSSNSILHLLANIQTLADKLTDHTFFPQNIIENHEIYYFPTTRIFIAQSKQILKTQLEVNFFNKNFDRQRFLATNGKMICITSFVKNLLIWFFS
jgi:hypothetical protein